MTFKITKNTLKKVLVMYLIANLGFGLQLAYSTPVAISRTLFEEVHISVKQYGFLFTFYSLPNVFMVIVGGILIDIIGTAKISVIFCGIATLASILTASYVHYGVMVVGRFFLGMGGETLLACATTMVPLFYSPEEVPMCMGLLFSIFYWGNLAALVILPAINKGVGLDASLWFVAVVFMIVFICNLLLIKFKKNLQWETTATTATTDDNNNNGIEMNKVELISRESSGGDIMYMEQDLEKHEQVEEDDEVDGAGAEQIAIDSNSEDSAIHTNFKNVKPSFVSEFVFKFKEIITMTKQLPMRFWLLAVICFFGYATMFGLAIIGTDVLEEKFGYSEQTAGLVMASEAIVNGILPMFTGLLMTKVRGRKIKIMILASFLLGMGTLLLNITDANPLPWIIMCGAGFSLLNTTLMSCVPLMVEMSIVGTGYGIVVTAYNFNVVIFPPILDSIKHSTGSYAIPLAILSVSSLVSIGLLIWLKVIDGKLPVSQSLDSPYSGLQSHPDDDFSPLKENFDIQSTPQSTTTEVTMITSLDDEEEEPNQSILI
ncbi:hypothetical protein CYY_004998 [Polysphondylium violaceum]|uniref:Lysosomal dipeptide transporter MFSD1 n=1 Tax=Polysphondylium violaceum TaxID=133409 RepID=A0A8J4USJ2_9MYCE|nr:hypothetical protein CYY_004998 [Polysphondylium violaceum]